jgi:hypothetical protein
MLKATLGWLSRFRNASEVEIPAGKPIHVILDNYPAHKHPKVIGWLARHPRLSPFYPGVGIGAQSPARRCRSGAVQQFGRAYNFALNSVPIAILLSWFATQALARSSDGKPGTLTNCVPGTVTLTPNVSSVCRAIS